MTGGPDAKDQPGQDAPAPPRTRRPGRPSLTSVEPGHAGRPEARGMPRITAYRQRARRQRRPDTRAQDAPVSICCTSRPRLAPSVEPHRRFALPRRTRSPRSRLATLAQAMSRTNATAPSRNSSVGRIPPTIDSSHSFERHTHADVLVKFTFQSFGDRPRSGRALVRSDARLQARRQLDETVVPRVHVAARRDRRSATTASAERSGEHRTTPA